MERCADCGMICDDWLCNPCQQERMREMIEDAERHEDEW